MKSSPSSTRFCFNARRISYGLVIGFGIGLATKNLAVGIALGVVFALAFSARRHDT